MSILRRVRKAVRSYEYLLVYNQENLKLYKDEYLKDTDIIQEVIDFYIREKISLLKIFYKLSIDLLSYSEESFIQEICLNIDRFLVDTMLKILSKQILEATIYKNRLLKVQERLNQFKYLL